MKYILHLRFIYIALFSLLFIACKSTQDIAPSANQPKATAKEIKLTIDAAKQYQTIDNFGASDAWSCQFVGQWPDQKKNAIADLLFSMDTTTEGKPKGIGLSLWRFNIGAGSAEQGNASGISDEWRRAESFLQANGQYNWQRQAGQQWFLQAAQARGVEQFLAFPNSPPVHLTKNGKAYASNGKANLSPNNYAAFADYLAKVAQGVEAHTGVAFQYLSPVNEPQWDWSDGGQEGTPYTNKEIAGIVRALNTEFEDENIPISIDVAEAGKINYLYTTDDKPHRGNQVTSFFDSNSSCYIGDLSKVGKVISAHSYFTTSPVEQAVGMREQVAQEVASVPDLKYWMSEYCILGDNDGTINGNERDLGMEPALYMAQVMHRDLTIANANAWHWWLAISPYDYKDGLIYIDKNKEDGNFYESKMLWTMGNYSRFIRPGAIRVAVENNVTDNSPLLVSSFVHPDTQQSTTIVINTGEDSCALNLQFKHANIASIRSYTTDAEGELRPSEPISTDQPMNIPPRSVTTLVGQIL